MALLKVKNLALGYEGHPVAEGVSFFVEAGDYVCVVGENGSGKTTLIRTLLGLMKPISGEILLGEGLVPSQIGYLPQQTDIQRDFPASVSEIVLSGNLHSLGKRPFYGKQEKQRTREMMAKMNILSLKDRSYRTLSGGQQQRVLLARALCAADRLLILDEPVAGLDPVVTEEMYGLIRKLHKEGMTLIMISHDIHTATAEATHILHMGEHIFFGTREAYQNGLTKEEVEKVNEEKEKDKEQEEQKESREVPLP